MSKYHLKGKHPKRHPKPHQRHTVAPPSHSKKAGVKLTGLQKSIGLFIIIAILAAIPFGLGKYFEFNTPGAFDSGAYVYSAQKILSGAEIGVEERPSAQLGTLLVNMLGVRLWGFSEKGPEVIQMILQAAALIMMFIAMRKLFGTFGAAVGVIVASIYLSAPTIAKYGNVKEQYMIAFMVLGASCFVLYQLSGKWWLAVLAGAFAGWAPLFKPTGLSVIGAIGVFVLAQAMLRRKTIRQTGIDILLLLGGAAVAIAPLYLWILGWDVQMGLPYAFVWQTLGKFLPDGPEAGQAAAGYISESREHAPFSEQWPRVLRYYAHLMLPIALALGAVIARILRLVWPALTAKKPEAKSYERFVLLFGLWWVLDMGFVWISPRSYEQYYLPLNASAAMLGGYLVAIYYDKAKTAVSRPKYVAIGLLGLLAMIIMSWQIFFGTTVSPHSGTTYLNRTTGEPERRRGYSQKFSEISIRRREKQRGGWELIGEHIRANSQQTDKIYVWGWYPGIYVVAQRLSPAPKAFEGNMHTLSPEVLSERIDEILTSFEKEPPKFIVDSLKQHFPWDRPPLQLWPQMQGGFLPNNKQAIEAYETAYAKLLEEKVEPAEAERFKVMGAFRKYVMTNYKVVQGQFSRQHVLFERK